MQKGTKSSIVAGLLGIFLGAFGAHDWYLNNTKKAITHVAICVGGIILLMIGLILTSVSQSIVGLNFLFLIIDIAAYIIIVANGIWGFIEGIMIIVQGDPGLAAKGYMVATPYEATAPMTIGAPVAGEATEQELKAATANANTEAKPADNTDPIPTATISTPPVTSFEKPAEAPAGTTETTPTTAATTPEASTTETPANTAETAPTETTAPTPTAESTTTPETATAPAAEPTTAPEATTAPATPETPAASTSEDTSAEVAPTTETPANNTAATENPTPSTAADAATTPAPEAPATTPAASTTTEPSEVPTTPETPATSTTTETPEAPATPAA